MALPAILSPPPSLLYYFSIENKNWEIVEGIGGWPEFREELQKVRSELFQGDIHWNFSLETLLSFANPESEESKAISSLVSLEAWKKNQVNFVIRESDCILAEPSFWQALEYIQKLGFGLVWEADETEIRLDRLGVLNPKKVLIDLRKLSFDDSNSALVIAMLTSLAERLSLPVVFKSIRSEADFFRALDLGATHLQGDDFQNNNKSWKMQSKQYIDSAFVAFHKEKRKQIAKQIHFENHLTESLESLNIKLLKVQSQIHLDPHSIFKLSPAIVRMYVTNWEGTQASPTYERSEEMGFREKKSVLGKNWSYMPFFFHHVKKSLRFPDQWLWSEPFFDSALQTKIQVISKVLENDYSLFIDVRVE